MQWGQAAGPEATCVSLQCTPEAGCLPWRVVKFPVKEAAHQGLWSLGSVSWTLSRTHSPCVVLTRQGDWPCPVCQGQRRSGWKP